jgi:hypothetical protein
MNRGTGRVSVQAPSPVDPHRGTGIERSLKEMPHPIGQCDEGVRRRMREHAVIDLTQLAAPHAIEVEPVNLRNAHVLQTLEQTEFRHGLEAGRLNHFGPMNRRRLVPLKNADPIALRPQAKREAEPSHTSSDDQDIAGITHGNYSGVQAEGCGHRLKGFRPKVGVRSSKTFSLNPFSLPISAYLPEADIPLSRFPSTPPIAPHPLPITFSCYQPSALSRTFIIEHSTFAPHPLASRPR